MIGSGSAMAQYISGLVWATKLTLNHLQTTEHNAIRPHLSYPASKRPFGTPRPVKPNFEQPKPAMVSDHALVASDTPTSNFS